MMKKIYLLCITFSIIPIGTNLAQQFNISNFASLKKDTFIIHKIIYDDLFQPDTLPYDSSIYTLNFFNPQMPDDEFFTYCTRSGNPFLSNNISKRILINNIFFPLNSFYPLLKTNQNANYVLNSNKPYTSLTYKFKGLVQSKDEFVDANFSRKISNYSHIGFHYNLYSNRSTSDYQHANDHSLYFYWITFKKNYFHLSQLYYNNFDYNETGGIEVDSLINYNNSEFYGTPVNLKNASSKLIYSGFSSTHKFAIFAIDSSMHEKNLDLLYQASFESNKKFYTEDNPNTHFYTHYYSRRNQLTDSLMLWRISNKIQLNAPRLSIYLPNLRVYVNHIIYESFHGSNIDTLVFLKPSKSWQQHYQVWMGGEISYRFPNFNAHLNLKSCLLGHGLGDQQMNANIKVKGKSDSSSYLNIGITSILRQPSFMLSNIYLNHYIWNKGDSLKKEFVQQLQGEIYLRPLSLNIKLEYFLLKNYIFFKGESLYQSDAWLNAFLMTLSHNFQLKNFSWYNKLYYQLFDDYYFQLPKWSIFSSIVYRHLFNFSTGGKLWAQIGFDFMYSLRYYPDTYLPPLGVFSLTNISGNNTSIAGNYPILSSHLTFNVKNVSFYIKYNHFNSWWNKRSFVGAHYPLLPAVFSYGINWIFYD